MADCTISVPLPRMTLTLTLLTIQSCDQKGWHEILGHCNHKDILKLKDVVEGMEISDSSSSKP